MKLSGNKIMYTNIVANLDRRHEVIEYHLQKYYNFRVKELTHDEVESMQRQVNANRLCRCAVGEKIPTANAVLSFEAVICSMIGECFSRKVKHSPNFYGAKRFRFAKKSLTLQPVNIGYANRTPSDLDKHLVMVAS